MTATVPAVATAVFDELSKLEGDERKRALHAALAMLGETVPAGGGGGGGAGAGAGHDDTPDASEYPPKARTWMRQNNVTAEHLSHVFHKEGETVEIIASSIPGNSKGKQMMGVYLLKGVAGLLANGEPKIVDKDARAAADSHACYDQPNHSNNFRQHRATYLGGSKEAGWTLTAPGLKAAAELVKSMTPAA